MFSLKNNNNKGLSVGTFYGMCSSKLSLLIRLPWDLHSPSPSLIRIVIISCAGPDDAVNEDNSKMEGKKAMHSLESLHCGPNHRAKKHVLRLSSPGFSTSSNSVFLPEFSLSNYFKYTSWSILIQPMEPNNHLLHRQATPAVLSSVRKQNYCRLIHPLLCLMVLFDSDVVLH